MDLKPRKLLRRVFDFARAELERRSRPPGADEAPEPFPEQRVESRRVARAPEGALRPVHSDVPSERPMPLVLEVSRSEQGVLRAHWAISQAHVERSERIAGERAILCLRLVSFAMGRDDVRREVLDRPFVEREGACDLGTADVRGVVAIGLRDGDRFVSIAHHLV